MEHNTAEGSITEEEVTAKGQKMSQISCQGLLLTGQNVIAVPSDPVPPGRRGARILQWSLEWGSPSVLGI